MPLDFYTTQSAFSAPNDLAGLYAGLPHDPRRLARTARGLMLHRLEGDRFGYPIPAERMHDDAETRYLDDILRILVERDDAPLTHRREPGNRFVGVCRDFALLYCSFLRHVGVPARLRSGFADYFGTDGFHGDHVVTEYRDDDRGWLLADPQLVDTYPVDFDPMDVPRDRFLVAGKAWRMIRTGDADAATFGLDPGPMSGEWFVANNVRLDIAMLNKVETLLWDIWGVGAGSDDEMTDEIRDVYDRAAPLSSDEVPFTAVRRLFAEDDGLRTPKTVVSLAPFNGRREVVLR